MDNKIFKGWLNIVDKQMKMQNRNILMFLDNFSGHQVDTYGNIKICFFPANCTSVLQPLDQSIIQSFKTKYRSEIIRDKLDAIEYG